MRTVKARIALVINENGKWNSFGYSGCSEKEMKELASEFFNPVSDCEQMYFVEVEVPVPEVGKLEGKIVEEHE